MSSSFSSTSNDDPQKIHDVFLSFRGEDTRNGFTSHLYHALVREGIRTFMDNDNLVSGNAISEGLMKAIQGSRSSVVILSERYAFSSWCLRELCRIVECMDTSGLIVIPIFYRVDPSHVRKLIGTYKDAFRKHEKNDELDSEMETWRDALKKVGNISGWTIEEKDVEALIIKDFIAKISSRLHIRKESQHELARRSKLQNVVYFDHDLMSKMVNPENAPFVVGKLLDGECPEEFIKGYILTLRSLLPVEQLLKECEKRNRLGLFTEFLEQLLREGSQDVHVHNALGKIIIDSNNNPEQFLTTNQHYDSHVLGEYCEKWNYPTYAAVAYSRGQCDKEFINVTNKNALFKLQARYVVERMDGELWKNVLDNRNEYRSKLIDEVITNALPESKSFDQVSAAIEVFSHASISHKLIELLEKIVLQNSVFSGNSELQGLLIQNAIKDDPTRVMGYIKNLDNFDGPAFGLLTEEAQLYEEAFVIYKKFKMNVEAVNVLLDKIQSVDRASEFASRVKEDAVWNQVRKAQHAAGDANVGHHHHLVNEPVDFDRSLERKRDHPVTATIHSLNSTNNPQKVVAEYKFDVFVTFWNGFIVGEFPRFLFDALDREGIRTFFDINDKREVKSAKTMKAAQSSRISIVILSTFYAFKEENLRNLCKIVECMETSGLIVVPIFYHVSPSHVREQTGRFRRRFKDYEKSSRFSTEEVKTWRDALKRVGDMTGWIIPKNFTWDENKKSAELVIADISNRLGILEEENVMDPKTYYEKFPLTGDEVYDFSSDEEED